MQTQKEEKLNLDISRIIWGPIGILVISLLCIMAYLIIGEIKDKSIRMNEDIKTLLMNQKRLFASEIFLVQPQAIKMRVNSIVNNINSLYPEATICLQAQSFAEEKMFLSYQKCSKNDSTIDMFKAQSIKKLNIDIAGNEIGNITYAAKMPLDIVKLFPKNLLIAIIISAFLAIFSHYMLVRVLRKKIVKPYLNSIKENERYKAVSEIASQVAHDIRSPLTALEMTIKDLNNIPERRRIIVRDSVQQIKDIANNLLKKRKLQNPNLDLKDPSEGKGTSIQLIQSLLDSIVTEKRMQYRSHLGLNIDFEQNTNSYGLFASINVIEFKIVISNIINNSVEALENNKGNIQVFLYSENDKILIKITDNGKGIPEDKLNKVMELGQSFGKEGGTGLGLAHANKCISKWNGNIHILSQINQGTTVHIELPKAIPPSWFISELKVYPTTTIVVFDDDPTIHEVWNTKFEKVGFNIKNIIHLSTPPELIEFVNKNKDNQNIIYLSDYEIIGFKETGIDLIEKLNIKNKSILITSSYDNLKLQKICEVINLKLIPKTLAPQVPIVIKQNNILTNNKYQHVHIDDDNLLRLTWKDSAKKYNINLLSLESPNQLPKYIDSFTNHTSFYIDQNLGKNEKKGEFIAKDLYDKGYKNLYLSTGYDPSDFKNVAWLKGIIGKKPPWEGISLQDN